MLKANTSLIVRPNSLGPAPAPHCHAWVPAIRWITPLEPLALALSVFRPHSRVIHRPPYVLVNAYTFHAVARKLGVCFEYLVLRYQFRPRLSDAVPINELILHLLHAQTIRNTTVKKHPHACGEDTGFYWPLEGGMHVFERESADFSITSCNPEISVNALRVSPMPYIS